MTDRPEGEILEGAHATVDEILKCSVRFLTIVFRRTGKEVKDTKAARGNCRKELSKCGRPAKFQAPGVGKQLTIIVCSSEKRAHNPDKFSHKTGSLF